MTKRDPVDGFRYFSRAVIQFGPGKISRKYCIDFFLQGFKSSGEKLLVGS